MSTASLVASLTPLVLLACPVGMGLMMLMMGRSTKGRNGAAAAPRQPQSVELLREEHRRLGEEIAQLETNGVPTEQAETSR